MAQETEKQRPGHLEGTHVKATNCAPNALRSREKPVGRVEKGKVGGEAERTRKRHRTTRPANQHRPQTTRPQREGQRAAPSTGRKESQAGAATRHPPTEPPTSHAKPESHRADRACPAHATARNQRAGSCPASPSATPTPAPAATLPGEDTRTPSPSGEKPTATTEPNGPTRGHPEAGPKARNPAQPHQLPLEPKLGAPSRAIHMRTCTAENTNWVRFITGWHDHNNSVLTII